MVQSLGSPIFSISRWQINSKEICNWIAWVLIIQSTSAELSTFLDHPPFDSYNMPSFHYSGFYSLLYQLKIWVDWRCNDKELNEATIWSLRLTLWSLGIFKINLQSCYHLEDNIRDSLQLFYILDYVFQSDRRLVFRILNYRSSLFMLNLIRVFSIFSILVYSQGNSKYAAHQGIHYRLLTKYIFMSLR